MSDSIRDDSKQDRDDGGPAFPVAGEWDEHRGEWFKDAHSGMTVLDYFAAAFLQGSASLAIRGSPEERAAAAYMVARAMIAKRNQQ